MLNGEVTHKWGIVGTGNIASAFARSFRSVDDAAIVAVSSRTKEAAGEFARTHGIGVAHGSLDDMCSDTAVDCVYVAGINTVHADTTVRLLEAGKHVLVEKPIAMTLDDVDRMIAASRLHDRFLMEAMWMRFNPLHVALVERIKEGEFGKVISVESDFSFDRGYDPGHRLFDPAKGGGSLVDVGIYPLTLAWWLLGEPHSATSTVERVASGVDGRVSLDLAWDGGATAQLTCGSVAEGPRTSRIVCERAEVLIPAPSHAACSAVVLVDGVSQEVAAEAASLHHQVAEVHRCADAGLRESPRMSHADSRAVLAFMLSILEPR